jgi:hypothetical protein
MAISFVQHKGAAAGPTPGTTVNLTFNSTTISANSIIVMVSTFGGTTSVTDNKGNTYVKVGTVTEIFTSKILDVWYSSGITGGASHQVTFVQATNAGYELVIEEYSGLIPTTAYDVRVSATGTATTANTGTSASTTSANELIWSGISVYGSQSDLNDLITSAGVGYSNFGAAGSGSTIICKESKFVSAISTYNATYSISAPAGFGPNSPNWAAILITFKAPTTQILSATSVGIASMTNIKARFLTLAATVIGVVAITNRQFFYRTLAAAVTGVALIGKQISKTLAAIAAGLVFMLPNKRERDLSNKGRIKDIE